MKAKITSVSPHTICLLVRSHAFDCGNSVIIEDASRGSGNQNRLFHELINIWISSGCSSYDGDLKKVKDYIKRDMGCGFESYIYADCNMDIIKCKKWEDVPQYNKDRQSTVLGKLKSWSCYTKKQRQNCIQNLIDNMRNSGVNSSKFEDILKEVNSV